MEWGTVIVDDYLRSELMVTMIATPTGPLHQQCELQREPRGDFVALVHKLTIDQHEILVSHIGSIVQSNLESDALPTLSQHFIPQEQPQSQRKHYRQADGRPSPQGAHLLSLPNPQTQRYSFLCRSASSSCAYPEQ